MLTKFPPRTILIVVGLLAAVLYAWLQLAPTTLGGKTSYLVSEGNSMEPAFHAGDLVLARPAGDYEVGDVIAYRSDQLNVTVMHRIIERGPGGFTTQGDNNDWIDSYEPTREDVMGVPWVHVPKVGTYLKWAAQPLNAALLILVGSIISFAGLFTVRKRRRRRGAAGVKRKPETVGFLSEIRTFLRAPGTSLSALPSPPSEEEDTVPESAGAPADSSGPKNSIQMLLKGIVAGLVPVLLLAAFAFTQSATRSETSREFYRQSNEFSYAAFLRPDPVYIDPPVVTGEPLFRQLVRNFEVYYDYKFTANAPQFMSGSSQLLMELSEESGWKRTFVLQPETAFEGNEVRLEGTIDLALFDQLITDFQELTGLNRTSFLLRIYADTITNGTVAGQACCAAPEAQPAMSFLIDPLQFLASTNGTAASRDPESFTSVVPTEIEVERVFPNKIGFMGFSISVGLARNLGWTAAVLLSPCVAGLAVLARRKPVLSESARIKSTYGPLLMDVEHPASSIQGTHFQTTSFASLVRMAEKLDLTILHSESGHQHTYFIHDGSAVIATKRQTIAR